LKFAAIAFFIETTLGMDLDLSVRDWLTRDCICDRKLDLQIGTADPAYFL